MIETAFVISICSTVLFTISEALPYISKIKSNGILQFLIDVLSKPQSPRPPSNTQGEIEQIISLLKDIKHNTQTYSLDTESQTASQ
jgi:hypothetical protein